MNNFVISDSKLKFLILLLKNKEVFFPLQVVINLSNTKFFKKFIFGNFKQLC